MPTLRCKARLATDSSAPSDRAFRACARVDLGRLAAPSKPYARATADFPRLQTVRASAGGRRAALCLAVCAVELCAAAPGFGERCRAPRRSRRCRKDTATTNRLHLATVNAAGSVSVYPLRTAGSECAARMGRPAPLRLGEQVVHEGGECRCDRWIVTCDAGSIPRERAGCRTASNGTRSVPRRPWRVPDQAYRRVFGSQSATQAGVAQMPKWPAICVSAGHGPLPL